METTLLVLDDDNRWRELDLFEELSINVIIQETDITDFESRRSPYSKTFQIPGTKNNNDFFQHFYEVNSTGFNPLIRRQCVVQYKGTDIFKGFLRLNSVNKISDRIEYEVYILSELTDFSSLVANNSLRELDWNDLNHIQNYDSVKLSWYADGSDNQGLFGGKVLYPLAHWGYEYFTPSGQTASTTSFEFGINMPGNKGIDFSGNSVPPTYFKPSVRLYEIVKRILNTTGYDVVSNFFDSDYFRSIYMDVGVNGQIGPITASGRTNQNIFRTYLPDLPTGQVLNFNNGAIQKLRFGRINGTDGYDPTFNFDEATSSYQIPYGGLYSFEFLGKVNQRTFNNNVATFYGFTLFKSSTRQGLNNPSTRTAVAGTPDNLFALNNNNSNNIRRTFNNVPLNAGDYVALFIRFNTSTNSNKEAGLWVVNYEGIGRVFGPRWDLYDSPTFVAENFVDMGLQFPEISSLDFLKSIIKMFNLVVVQTRDPKKFRIEPLTWYYSQNFAETVDWTERFDLNSPHRIEPINFQLQKEVNFEYENPEKEYLGKLWFDEYAIPYGSKNFVSKSDILTGSQVIKFPFRSVPTDSIINTTNIIIPMFYELDEANERLKPFSNKNHLFFWTGNRFFYADTYSNPSSWYMTSGATPIEQTTYPCISHLSTLDSQDPERISDLNFDKNFDFFGFKNNVIQQFTQYNLYELWYGDYFTNLYSPEVRRLTGRVLFNPLDISNINLTDKIFIKDSIYSIERINEADLVNWKLTEVSLIKQVVEYNKIIPPAPNYDIMPGQPFPPSGATFELSAYTSSIQELVCLNQSPVVILWSSTPTIQDGSFLYSDSGATTPYNTGIFFKEISGTTVYQTINNLGFVVRNDC